MAYPEINMKYCDVCSDETHAEDDGTCGGCGYGYEPMGADF